MKYERDACKTYVVVNPYKISPDYRPSYEAIIISRQCNVTEPDSTANVAISSENYRRQR